jgi:hypothetical protein
VTCNPAVSPRSTLHTTQSQKGRSRRSAYSSSREWPVVVNGACTSADVVNLNSIREDHEDTLCVGCRKMTGPLVQLESLVQTILRRMTEAVGVDARNRGVRTARDNEGSAYAVLQHGRFHPARRGAARNVRGQTL